MGFGDMIPDDGEIKWERSWNMKWKRGSYRCL